MIGALLTVSRAYNDIDHLLKKYEMGKTKKRASELSKTFSVFYEKQNELKIDIVAAINVKIDASPQLITKVLLIVRSLKFTKVL